MWQIINTHINNSNDDYNLTGLQSDELNNFFVNLGIEAAKHFKSKNSPQKYFKTELISHFLLKLLTY